VLYSSGHTSKEGLHGRQITFSLGFLSVYFYSDTQADPPDTVGMSLSDTRLQCVVTRSFELTRVPVKVLFIPLAGGRGLHKTSLSYLLEIWTQATLCLY